MLGPAERAFAIVLMIIGIFLLPREVYDATKSSLLYWITIAFIASIVSFYYAREFMASLFNWRLGYNRFPTPGFIGRRSLHMDIGKDFTTRISRTSQLVFLKPPRATDLIDVMDSLPGHQVEERHYRSNDGEVRDIKHKDGAIRVYWGPRDGEIQPLVPYEHHMSYVSPSPYGDDAFYHSNYFDRDVGIATFTASTPVPVVEAVAFTLPFWQSAVTDERLLQHYKLRPRRGCPQPVILAGGRTVEWTLPRPKKGRVYVLFCVYEGMTDPYLVNGTMVFKRSAAPSSQGTAQIA